MDPVPEDVTLPCGCQLLCAYDEQGRRVFTVVACAKGISCKNVIFLTKAAAEMGKPVEVHKI